MTKLKHTQIVENNKNILFKFLNKRKYIATIACMLGEEFKEIEGY